MGMVPAAHMTSVGPTETVQPSTVHEPRLRARLESATRLAALADARDHVEPFRALYTEVGRAMDATVFLLALYDGARQRVHVVRQADRGHEQEVRSFTLGKGLTAEVCASG